MFFSDLSQLPSLARKTNFSIFAVDPAAVRPLLEKVYQTSCLFFSPDEKTGKLSVETIRDLSALTDSQETADRFFCVEFAETMTPAAANAFLKNLEEPRPFCHFVFLTPSPSALLPTVLSRAQVFFLKNPSSLDAPVAADEKTKALAKQLIVADPKALISLGNDLSKKKDNARAQTLAVVGTAIEILYKSYFKTNQEKFLSRLPNLLKLYENLSKNGHIKLHLVADMI
ncbi:hypothetical protein IJI72_00745 [Candidatus Saccharibacteria bacterium]|nr:hypothetical protein [Candidatus Saccharibacteria bacterium]